MVRLHWRTLVLIVLVLVAPACAPAAPPGPALAPIRIVGGKYLIAGDYAETITLEGVERQFIVHIPPAYRLDQPMPLVINMHGRGGTAAGQERSSAMFAKADEEGFIVVNPQALGRPATWWPAPGPQGQADLEFFQAMVEYVESQLNIDPARIYATGLSNGGAMANRLGCAMADKFAAIAPVAGAHPQMESCDPTLPVAVIVFHGSLDDVIPYMGDGGYLPPVPAWAAAWARRNDCQATPLVDYPREKVARQTWGNCSGGATVMLYTIEGGRHEWPGAYLEGVVPAGYATDVIWDFFKAHPRLFGP
jgi:polyhydroxybutyrate depolymerase